MPSSRRRIHADGSADAVAASTTWVIVASRDHARRGVAEGFIMANHGKRPPLARMRVGDGIVVYSPKTAHPAGDPLQAITVVGTVTGAAPEPSDLIANGYRRRADLREIECRWSSSTSHVDRPGYGEDDESHRAPNVRARRADRCHPVLSR